jgi:hypothetical protein
VGGRALHPVDHGHRDRSAPDIRWSSRPRRRLHVGSMAREGPSPRSSQPALIRASAIGGSRACGARPVDQQGLGRAAHRHAAHLGVQHDVDGLLRIGGRVDEHVVQALQVAQHRHPGLGLDPRHQALAAPGDDQVDRAVQARQDRAHGVAVGRADHLHGVGRDPRRLQPLGDGRVDGEVGLDALGPAAQDHRIARAHAQRGGVGGDVGPALEDHGDHADRRAHPGDVQAVGTGPAGGLHAQRIGDGGHGLDAGGHAFQALGVQHQPLDHRRGQAAGPGLVEVAGVGGQDGGGASARMAAAMAFRAAVRWAGVATRRAAPLPSRLSHRRHRRLQAHARVVHRHPPIPDMLPRYAQSEAYLGALRAAISAAWPSGSSDRSDLVSTTTGRAPLCQAAAR